MQRISPQFYRVLEDAELVARAQSGDRGAESQILQRYRSLVKQRILPYYLIGAERDDLFQEGMIGLHKAVKGFEPRRAVSFKHFAALCILRQILSAIKAANRQKHSPLTGYTPLSAEVEDQRLDSRLFIDPDEELFKREGVEWIKGLLKKHLSHFEWTVLALYLGGFNYEEISGSLQRNGKAIDNALSRIREKGRELQIQTLLP